MLAEVINKLCNYVSITVLFLDVNKCSKHDLIRFTVRVCVRDICTIALSMGARLNKPLCGSTVTEFRTLRKMDKMALDGLVFLSTVGKSLKESGKKNW